MLLTMYRKEAIEILEKEIRDEMEDLKRCRTREMKEYSKYRIKVMQEQLKEIRKRMIQ